MSDEPYDETKACQHCLKRKATREDKRGNKVCTVCLVVYGHDPKFFYPIGMVAEVEKIPVG